MPDQYQMIRQRIMPEVNNTPEAIELRRRQNVLTVVGAGTIIFGVWTLLKSVGVLLLAKDRYLPILKEMIESGGEAWEDWYYLLLILMTVVSFSVELMFRLFVGWAAISEGSGRRRSIAYIIVAFIMLWSGIWTISGLASDYGQELAHMASGGSADPDNKASLSAIIIEITSFIMLAEIVYSSIRVRRLTKRREKHAKHEG